MPVPPAQDSAGANETLMGMRLGYDRAMSGVEDFDPMSGTFVKAMLWEFAVFGAVAWMSAFVVLPIALLMGASSALSVVYLIALAVVWLVYVFRPIPVPLSEWKFLVDGRAAAAGTAFEHIGWAFQRRRTPVNSLRVRRLAHSMQDARDYLEVRDGIFTGYVSCFGYGEDLFVGWTFWWNLSPFRWFLIALGRLWQTLTLRGSQLYIIARYEGGKALRDAVHAAAREGVDVASGDVASHATRGIGAEIPVEMVAPAANVPGFIERADAGPPSR